MAHFLQLKPFTQYQFFILPLPDKKKQFVKKHFVLQESSEEAEGKVGELLRAVEELQSLLKNATDANQELENQRKQEVAECHSVIQQRGENSTLQV